MTKEYDRIKKNTFKEGRMSVKEWNKNIIPKIKTGELKDISNELPKGFLLVYQLMEGLILDTKTGKKYRCVAWSPPKITDDNGKDITPEPYVEIKLYDKELNK
jgi:hypothetical protein